MYGYTPKFSHVILSTVLAVALLWGSAFVEGKGVTALTIGSVALFIFAGVTLLNMFVVTSNERWEKMESFASTYSKLDEESRAALGFVFPTLRYKMKRGEVKQMFEDTNVTADQFRLFLQTSNDRYISPERDWATAEMPRSVWLEIKGWLEERKYILEDSAAGSHSWLWSGNSYHHLMAYWMQGRQIKNMNNTVYAYEE